MSNELLIPMIVHIMLTAFLYVLLTVMRAPNVWKIGMTHNGTNPWGVEIEPRTSANLSNQFEWPLFFHIICVLLIVKEPLYDSIYLYLAWLFIAGRILHSVIHIFTSNIRLRGAVFTINFLAVLSMWALLLLDIV